MKKFNIAIIIILIIIVYCIPIQSMESELLNRELYQGLHGVDVALVQIHLYYLGFYKGPIDGIFGSSTHYAVIGYQNYHNMNSNGIINGKTFKLFADNISIDSVNRHNNYTVNLLARIINGEARGESLVGMVGVGSVVLNRVYNKRFPNTINGVINQNNQFCAVKDGQFDLQPTKEAIFASKLVLAGYDPTYNSIYFFNPKTATDTAWSRNKQVILQIGNHLFLK